MAAKQQILDVLSSLPDPDGDEAGLVSAIDPARIKQILEIILFILKTFGLS